MSDDQHALVMTAAGSLQVEKRSIYLERIAAKLRLHGPTSVSAPQSRPH
jgi:hypothetical protein